MTMRKPSTRTCRCRSDTTVFAVFVETTLIMQTRCGHRECQTRGPPASPPAAIPMCQSHVRIAAGEDGRAPKEVRSFNDGLCNWFLTPLFHALLLTLNYRHDTALVECWHCCLCVRLGARLLGHGGLRLVCRERPGAIESAANDPLSLASNERGYCRSVASYVGLLCGHR